MWIWGVAHIKMVTHVVCDAWCVPTCGTMLCVASRRSCLGFGRLRRVVARERGRCATEGQSAPHHVQGWLMPCTHTMLHRAPRANMYGSCSRTRMVPQPCTAPPRWVTAQWLRRYCAWVRWREAYCCAISAVSRQRQSPSVRVSARWRSGCTAQLWRQKRKSRSLRRDRDEQ